MPHYTEEKTQSVQIIAQGNLGSEMMGSFGPNSDAERDQTNDYAKPEYVKPPTDESYCMDDRFEGFGIQLPGNRATTEIAGEYMDSEVDPDPMSRKVARKNHELVTMGRPPVYHGDKIHGKKGCAALVLTRSALTYLGSHSEESAHLTFERLRLLGIDNLTVDDLLEMISTGQERADNDALWDVDPEDIIDIAQENGAGYIEFDGAHHTAGPREDMSPYVFDNAAFRAEHQTDDGHPMGALSLTYGAYVEQLKEDGFSDEAIANKVAQAILFSVAVVKLACKKEAVDTFVGFGMVD